MHDENRDTEIAPAAPERADAGSRHSPGDTLAGRFVLQERLGSGGSGTVFSALDTRVGDRVAVKILDRATHDPANRERLRREIRATRSGHPNVVSIHELHEGGGVLFITMELVEGSSLRETLAERPSLIVDDVVLIGRQIASALDHLHAQGLVHRDVKPGNIMLARDGRAKLCDMGLARPLEAGATVTESEMAVGTPTSMAPEMARSGELVAASDVYALGLTLYQCLSGEVPLAGTTAVDTLMARQKARPRSVRALRPECPRWLGRLLDRMLDLFGPGRTMAATTPDGMEVHYIAMANQRLVPPLTPWRYCFISGVSAVGGDQFLAVHTDRTTWKNSTKTSYLRSFMFDALLRLTDGMWVIGPLEDREIDQEIEARPDQLGVTYWNGTAWQPEVCAIPQAE